MPSPNCVAILAACVSKAALLAALLLAKAVLYANVVRGVATPTTEPPDADTMTLSGVVNALVVLVASSR